MAVNAFVGHHGAEKDQVRSCQDVEHKVKIILNRQEQRSDCQHADRADYGSAEMKDASPTHDDETSRRRQVVSYNLWQLMKCHRPAGAYLIVR